MDRGTTLIRSGQPEPLSRSVTGAPVPVIPGNVGSGPQTIRQGASTVPLSLKAIVSALFPNCLCISCVFYHKPRKSQWAAEEKFGPERAKGQSGSGCQGLSTSFARVGSLGSFSPGKVTISRDRPQGDPLGNGGDPAAANHRFPNPIQPGRVSPGKQEHDTFPFPEAGLQHRLQSGIVPGNLPVHFHHTLSKRSWLLYTILHRDSTGLCCDCYNFCGMFSSSHRRISDRPSSVMGKVFSPSMTLFS